MIVRAEEGCLLQNILRDFKGFTSREILKAISNNPQESGKEWLLEKFRDVEENCFWATENHPIELWSNEVINQKLDYLHNNPVEEGLVFRAEDYVYSSAVDYSGEKGLLNVIIIE
jgi:hypothetical protein